MRLVLFRYLLNMFTIHYFSDYFLHVHINQLIGLHAAK